MSDLEFTLKQTRRTCGKAADAVRTVIGRANRHRLVRWALGRLTLVALEDCERYLTTLESQLHRLEQCEGIVGFVRDTKTGRFTKQGGGRHDER